MRYFSRRSTLTEGEGKQTQLIIDVAPGRGGMFALEGPEGLRFLIRSCLFGDEEQAALGKSRPTARMPDFSFHYRRDA